MSAGTSHGHPGGGDDICPDWEREPMCAAALLILTLSTFGERHAVTALSGPERGRVSILTRNGNRNR